jgi:type I restriction enzyme S subunit
MSKSVETEIGTIAPNWKVCSLEDVCEPPQYGYTASAGDKGNTQFLRITDITESGVKWGTVPYCECPKKNLSKYLLASGDIVFARIGATTGKSYLIADPPPSVFASYLIRVRPKKEIDPAFLSHFFRTNSYWRQIDAQKGSSLKKGVNGSLLKKLKVPVPPLPEQKKIAHILSMVQRAIEVQERIIQTTTELKKALMQKLFTEGLRGEPQKETEIGLVPESWEVSTLGELACKPNGFLQTGPFGSQLHKHDYLEEGVGVVNPTHLWGNRINHEDVPRVSPETAAQLDRHRLEAGDILFARRGEIGRHGMVTKDEIGWLCGTGCFLVRVRLKRIDNRFLSYLFSTPGVIAWLNSHAAGAIMPNLNNTVLRSMPVCYPKQSVQVEIADCLDSADQKILIHEHKKQSLNDLFRTLLHQLMTAEIRMHDFDSSSTLDFKIVL